MGVNLGTATAYIDLDSSRFSSGIAKASNSLSTISRESRKAESEFNHLSTTLTGSANSFKRLEAKTQALNARIKASKETTKTYKEAMKDISEVVKKAEKEHESLGKKLTSLQKHLDRSKQMYGENSEQAKRYAKSIDEVKRQQDSLEKEIKQGNVAIEEFGIAMKNSETQTSKLQKEMDNLNFAKTVDGFKGVGKMATVVFATLKTSFKLGVAGAKEFGNDVRLLGNAFTKMGRVAVSGLRAVANEGLAFEQTMYQVKAITGANEESFKKLTNVARDWGSRTRYSANEVAEAMTYMGMA